MQGQPSQNTCFHVTLTLTEFFFRLWSLRSMGSRHLQHSLRTWVTKLDKRTIHISAGLQNLAAEASTSKDARKQFPVISVQSEIEPDQFRNNKNAFKVYSEKFRQILEFSNAGGGEKAIARHVKQHRKLLPMDRIKLLLDSEEDFLELSTIAGYKMEYGDIPKAGVLTGGLTFQQNAKS